MFDSTQNVLCISEILVNKQCRCFCAGVTLEIRNCSLELVRAMFWISELAFITIIVLLCIMHTDVLLRQKPPEGELPSLLLPSFNEAVVCCSSETIAVNGGFRTAAISNHANRHGSNLSKLSSRRILHLSQ